MVSAPPDGASFREDAADPREPLEGRGFLGYAPRVGPFPNRRRSWGRIGILWMALLALPSPGCRRKAAEEPEADLSFALGAVAECRTLFNGEALGSDFAARAEREQAFMGIVGGYATGMPSPPFFPGPGNASNVTLRVEVVLKGAKPAVQVSVTDPDGGAPRVVPLRALRRGTDAEPRIAIVAIGAPIHDDAPPSSVEVGTIDPHGRIALTACRERWSLGPVDARGSAGRSPEGSQPAARYYGGRPIAWWRERLAELKRDGTPELYALALRRARAAGLAVEERGEGVAVDEPAPEGSPR